MFMLLRHVSLFIYFMNLIWLMYGILYACIIVWIIFKTNLICLIEK